MSAEHRTKIANSQILNRLIGHAEGSIDMTASQVTAASILLKKVMPDLTATTISGDDENPVTIIRRVIIDGPDDQDPEGV
jgi:molybdopterin/thiamine biosynthesis adenylyltransferase